MSDLGNGILYTMNATEDVFLERENSQFWQSLHTTGIFLIVGSSWTYPHDPKTRTLVKFDDIPSSCTNIQWAKMYLYFCHSIKAVYSTSEGLYTPRPLQVHQVKEPWKESQVTNDYRLSGIPWSKSYLGVDGSDAMEHPMDIVTIFPGRPFGYVEFDITEAACKWKAGEPNYGVVLLAVNEDVCGPGITFFSHRNANPEYHPFMTVFSTHQ